MLGIADFFTHLPKAISYARFADRTSQKNSPLLLSNAMLFMLNAYSIVLMIPFLHATCYLCNGEFDPCLEHIFE